jgi:hypothetical protein
MDGCGQDKAPLPVGRTPPFIVIHQEYAQVTADLMLCAVVITPWPSRASITLSQAGMVGLVESQLIGDQLAGRFPDGDDYAFWLDLATGSMTVLDLNAATAGTWLRYRMRDYLTVTLSAPKPEAG